MGCPQSEKSMSKNEKIPIPNQCEFSRVQDFKPKKCFNHFGEAINPEQQPRHLARKCYNWLQKLAKWTIGSRGFWLGFINVFALVLAPAAFRIWEKRKSHRMGKIFPAENIEEK